MTRYEPNIVRGGRATNIKDNLYYMSGRKHEAGGIDIGKNPKTGLEVEDGEIVQTSPNGLKVFSAQPILNGNSPAKLVMGGANPAKVFNAQERFKEVNGINDDGTKKKRMGGLSRSKDYGSSKKPYPSVDKKDFAGGGRSYPIPTKADAVDALRLAGLHGRSDVKAKVYKKYPDLKKKRMGGIREDYPTLAGEYYGRQEAKTIKALRNARTNPQYQGRNLNLPTLSMNDAYGNLPVTSSNRTAIERTNAKYNTPAVKPKTKRQSFNSAFAAARKQGLSEFTWNGKRYGTKLASEVKSSTPKYEISKAEKAKTLAKPLASRDIAIMNTDKFKSEANNFKRNIKNYSTTQLDSIINAAYNPIEPTGKGIDNNYNYIAIKLASDYKADAARIEKKYRRYNKAIGGKVVTVNGNIIDKLVGDVHFPSPTGGRKKAALGTDERDKDYVVMNGQLYQVTNDEFGETAYMPIDEDTPNSRIDKEVESAARRDAKGVRTDFRDMLERPQYSPNKIESKPKAETTRSTRVEQPVQTTTTTKQTKVTAPRRGSGKSKPKTVVKPAEPTKPAPKFADLNSMIQGINTKGAQMPTKIEPRTIEGASTNKGVLDVIKSPRKRLALFDKLNANDIIGLAGNIGGSVASAITSRKALNDMEAPSEPMYEVPTDMKTHFNIRPQISEINENTRRSMDDVTANTSSSRVALQRKQRLRNTGQYAKNNLYGQKENIETQLINQDRLNRQRVGSRNTAAYNDWRNRTTQFRNAIREQKASSLNNMFSGINAGLQDMLSRIENRRNYNNTLGIYDATHPNTDKRLFRDKGVTI